MQKPLPVKSIISSSNKFGLSLLQQIPDEKTVLISPFSLTASLYMLYLGSEGKTEAEVKKVLGIKVEKNILATSFHDWSKMILQKNQDCSFFLANGMWAEKTTPILPSYSRLLNDEFHAKIQNVNFLNKPYENLQDINYWIAQKTDFEIDNLVSKQDVSFDTKILLGNALSFKGNWELGFDRELTKPSPFFTDKNKQVYVEMMHQVHEFPFFENNELAAIALPLSCETTTNQLSLLFILPKNFASFSVDEKKILKVLSNLKPQIIDVKIPKIVLLEKYNLNNELNNLGMNNAYSRVANFSSINGKVDLFLSEVLHGASLSLNEYGIDTSLENSSSINLQSFEHQPNNSFLVNKPFFVLLMEMKSKSIVMIGKIAEPPPTIR